MLWRRKKRSCEADARYEGEEARELTAPDMPIPCSINSEFYGTNRRTNLCNHTLPYHFEDLMQRGCSRDRPQKLH